MPTVFDGAVFFIALTLGVIGFAARVFSALDLEKISRILERLERRLEERDSSANKAN